MFRAVVCALFWLTIFALEGRLAADEKKPSKDPFPREGKGAGKIEWNAAYLEDAELFAVLSRKVTKGEITWALKLKTDQSELPLALQTKLYNLNLALELVGGCEVQFLDEDNIPIKTVRFLLKPGITKKDQVTRPVLKLPDEDVLEKTKKVVFKE